jgi:hypothetical protein
VIALNQRAQARHLEDGTLDPESAVVLRAGQHAHVGDTIVTRLNRRRMTVRGGTRTSGSSLAPYEVVTLMTDPRMSAVTSDAVTSSSPAPSASAAGGEGWAVCGVVGCTAGATGPTYATNAPS